MINRWFTRLYDWLKLHHKRVLVFGGGGFVVALVVAQLLYPADRLLPLAYIDGLPMGGWSKSDAVVALNSKYLQTTIDLHFGHSKKAYRSPNPTDIGLSIDNTARIDDATYPWYIRILPGSLLWGSLVTGPHAAPTYTRDSTAVDDYIKSEFGDSCSVSPIDASIEVSDGKLVLQHSSPGGVCKVDDLKQALLQVEPIITAPNSITISAEAVPAVVRDVDAQKLISQIDTKIANGITVTVGDKDITIPAATLISWLDFSTTGNKLVYSLNADRASEYLTQTFASKVLVAAGVTTVSTRDFVEISRQTGVSGQTLDITGTLTNIKDFIDGTSPTVSVATTVTAPTIKYTRSYSATDTGLSALMSNYAQTHAGTYGVSLIELSGQYRRASYNAEASFTTASTYKLFVAYSSLLRVESGEWSWSDQIQGGRDLATCLDDMIVVSDNDCGYALLTKIGFAAITNEAHDIGCVDTSFMGNDGIKTTPQDLALFMAELQSGQILKQQSNRDILINAMKRNIYRQGIPAGSTGVVADKVGFLDGLLHDAAIVYSPDGTYVLVIMTDGASWSNIADLTSQIEALRAQ